jgi:hypothetical protein
VLLVARVQHDVKSSLAMYGDHVDYLWPWDK